MINKKIQVCTYIIFMCFFVCMQVMRIDASVLKYESFKPNNEEERVIDHTAIGSWNNGEFFETVTYQRVGFDDDSMTMKYRFRYYITHKGIKGSYIYQKVPVGIFVNDKKIASFSSWIGKNISNKTQLCGEKTVTIHQGKHLVELKDIKDGAITVVNVKKMIVIAIPTYSVKFLDSDGTVLKTQTVERYKSATAPAVSDKPGASFTGWDKPFNNVREDLIVTAQYAVNTYSVNFLDWDGRILKTQTVQHGGNASPPSSPSREGYVFQGWKGDYTNVTGNRTITAAYKIKTFTITFDSNGGSSIAPQIITYGDKAGVPANPIKKNNKFMGWHTAAGVRYDFSQPVKESMTLYAYWDEEPIITAQDIHIFEDLYTEQDWKRIRLERAKALDKEDGDISAHLTILKDTTNLKKQGTYELTYEVKDSAGNRAKKSINVIVLDKRAQEDRSRKYIRSISENHIQTLHPNSYWRITERFQRLTQSLQKTTAQARYTWHLTGQDIAEIRRFNAEHGYSEQENKAFMEKFSYLRR